MQSTEEKAIRLQHVDMHDFFLNRIEVAIEEQRYIEASWLIYSCMENRFYRTLQKYKRQCKYCKGNSKCKSKKNDLAISTKIDCIRRLVEENVSCITDSFTTEQLDEIKKWVKNRNTMMHDLLSLAEYKDMDEKFKLSAFEGKNI